LEGNMGTANIFVHVCTVAKKTKIKMSDIYIAYTYFGAEMSNVQKEGKEI